MYSDWSDLTGKTVVGVIDRGRGCDVRDIAEWNLFSGSASSDFDRVNMATDSKMSNVLKDNNRDKLQLIKFFL